MKTTYVDISNVVGCKTNRTFSIARNRGYDHLKHISSALLSIANRCKKDNHITDKLSVITNARLNPLSAGKSFQTNTVQFLIGAKES